MGMSKKEQEDNIELFKQYKKTPTTELREKIILNNVILVKIIARRMYVHLGSTVEVEDLESYGILGLISAIDRFDVDMGLQFETYASQRIQGAMLDEIRKLDWIPRTIRSTETKINNFTKEYSDQYGKDPTEEKIAEHLGVSVDQIYNHQSLMIRSNLSSLDDNKMLSAGSGYDRVSVYETIVDTKSQTPEKSYLKNKDLPEILQKCLDTLTEKEKKVVLLFYYEELNMNEIAQVLEVSESRVSQLHKRALERMKEYLTKTGNNDILQIFVA